LRLSIKSSRFPSSQDLHGKRTGALQKSTTIS
jgi:hypothetical protein